MSRALILTGTSGAGKSTLSRLLQQDSDAFEQVKAITTRPERLDDEPGVYEYHSQNTFAQLRDSLIISAQYRGNQYGITLDHLQEVLARGKTAILVITPRSLVEYLRSERAKLVSSPATVFVDAPDDVLNERLGFRGPPDALADVLAQRLEDRSYISFCEQYLLNLNLESSLKKLKSSITS